MTRLPPPPPSELVRQRRGRSRWRWLLLTGAVVLLGVAAAGGLSQMSQPQEKSGDSSASSDAGGPVWYDVARRSFDLTVAAGGELEAKQKVEIKSEVEGATTIVEVVPEGTAVKAGDVVVRLAADDISEKVSQESINTQNALADKVAAESTLAIQLNQNESSLKAARLKLNLAELDLAKWEKGSDPQKRRELDLALEKARRTLVQTRRNKELSQQLYDEKFISQSELEDDEIKALEAVNELATAELNIKVYEAYSRPAEEKKAISDVEQARAELDRTARENERNIEKLRAEVASKTSNYKIRSDRLARLEDQLEKTIIKAPNDGLVVYATSVGPTWRRQSPISQGRQVRLGESIMILPDPRQMVAALKVNEALVAQVKLNQKVSVLIDARATRPIEGLVALIGVTAEEGGWMNPDLREYIVRVDLPPGIDNTLKPSMRCMGQILIGRVENAIAVPIQAVFTEGDERFCYVPATSSRVKRQTLKLGPASESYVQVLEGLAEGDRVLLRKPKPGEALEKS